MLVTRINFMSRLGSTAALRVKAVAQHTRPMSTSTEPHVLFESTFPIGKYSLNRLPKRHALTLQMLDDLRHQVEAWNKSELCRIIIGTGVGGVFCAGGDVVGVAQDLAKEETRPQAIEYFKREFETDYILANLSKPYVVIMDGITKGGGVGISAHAPFRIATENTVFAMPETKIGFFPDVGGSYFLSKLDGCLGMYLGLTGSDLVGRHVFECGLATHYVPSSRIPQLLDNLASLDDPTHNVINSTIEELYQERDSSDPPPAFVGTQRKALDLAFQYSDVELIIDKLELLAVSRDYNDVNGWAKKTLEELHMRSPTSLKVALRAIRSGRGRSLKECLQMDLGIATAFCNGASPDFTEGVKAMLIDKPKRTPVWSPSKVAEVDTQEITRGFFEDSKLRKGTPSLSIPDYLLNAEPTNPATYALPTEKEIIAAVNGSEHSVDALESHCRRLRPGKHGVKEKVLDVVSRKGEIVNTANGRRKIIFKT